MSETAIGISSLKHLPDGHIKVAIRLLPLQPHDEAKMKLAVVLPPGSAPDTDRIAEIEREALRRVREALNERIADLDRVIHHARMLGR